MANDSVTFSDMLRKMGWDLLRDRIQALVDAEVTAHTWAGYRERSEGRQNQRDGYRVRAWDTWVGTLDPAAVGIVTFLY